VPSTSWSEAFRVHGSAASAFAAAAEAVEPEAWDRPRAEGKWSPAQITDHLIRTYDVVLREIGGGAGMKVRTPFLMRIVLRLTYKPRILRGGWFPARAPAPPEIRPSKAPPGQQDGIALFRQRAQEFETAFRAKPEARLTHAYFGTLKSAAGLLFCARHIEHHCAQLEALERP